MRKIVKNFPIYETTGLVAKEWDGMYRYPSKGVHGKVIFIGKWLNIKKPMFADVELIDKGNFYIISKIIKEKEKLSFKWNNGKPSFKNEGYFGDTISSLHIVVTRWMRENVKNFDEDNFTIKSFDIGFVKSMSGDYVIDVINVDYTIDDIHYFDIDKLQKIKDGDTYMGFKLFVKFEKNNIEIPNNYISYNTDVKLIGKNEKTGKTKLFFWKSFKIIDGKEKFENLTLQIITDAGLWDDGGYSSYKYETWKCKTIISKKIKIDDVEIELKEPKKFFVEKIEKINELGNYVIVI